MKRDDDINLKMYFTFAASSPVITKQPVDVNVTLYNSASFICAARSFGSVKLTWRRVNYSLPITATVTEEQSLNELSSTLTISEVVGYYSGQYYCAVENKVGKTSSQIVNLHVNQSKICCITLSHTATYLNAYNN